MIYLHLILLLCLIIPIILQYIYHWNVNFNSNNNVIYISVYGIYLFIYLFIQFIFSFMNNFIKYTGEDKTENENENNNSLINLIIVGYKENPQYFKNCLISIKTIYYNNCNLINRIYIVIDGNQQDDTYMIDIVHDIFKEDVLFTDGCGESTDVIRTNFKFICISQEHNGKRSAMYKAFNLSFLEKNTLNKDIKAIFCTDSDTVIKNECIEQMFNTFKNPKIGAVTGNLSIYNKYDSTISFLSSIRYWYAFNLERSYQSFNNYVICISGPIGMYKTTSLEKVVEEWNNQMFLGKKCNYGDDRHLTNKILSLGEDLAYIYNAEAETETPHSIYRFYK